MNNNMEKIKWYGSFDTSNVLEFESTLYDWIKRNGKQSNLCFDDSNLQKISETLIRKPGTAYLVGIIYKNAPEGTKVIHTENFIIEWHTFTGTKSILKSVKDLDGKVLYEEPKTWKETTLWYDF